MWEHSFHPIPPFLPCKATVRSFPDIEPAGGLHDKTTSSVALPFGRNVWALPCALLCQSSWPILFYSGTEKSQFSGSFPCIPCLQLQCFPLTSEGQILTSPPSQRMSQTTTSDHGSGPGNQDGEQVAEIRVMSTAGRP